MRIKTNKEIIEHTIKQIEADKLVGIIPFDLWDLIIQYELRSWFLSNAQIYEFSDLIKETKNKINHIKNQETARSIET